MRFPLITSCLLYSMLQPVKPHNSHQSIGTRQTGDKASSKPAFNQTAGGLTPFQANWYLKLDEFGGVFTARLAIGLAPP